ncbi:MAG: molybdenum cofactor biosynthesis protein MoaE [Leadbetterella sp.]
MEKVNIHITNNPLNLQACISFVEDHSVGGQVYFVGTVRNHTQGKEVLYLDFEAYEPMAIREMEKIAKEAIEKFGIFKIAIHHRIGKLELGQEPVIIAVSSSHRKAAFEACQYAIDTLKETVPIWKKEYFQDGEVWVSATP